MNYDTFYTLNYKGVYIHAKHNRALKREEFTVNVKEFTSLLSAKRHITKLLKAT